MLEFPCPRVGPDRTAGYVPAVFLRPEDRAAGNPWRHFSTRPEWRTTPAGASHPSRALDSTGSTLRTSRMISPTSPGRGKLDGGGVQEISGPIDPAAGSKNRFGSPAAGGRWAMISKGPGDRTILHPDYGPPVLVGGGESTITHSDAERIGVFITVLGWGRGCSYAGGARSRKIDSRVGSSAMWPGVGECRGLVMSATVSSRAEAHSPCRRPTGIEARF